MPPQTTTAQAAFRRPFEPGSWLCVLCVPNVQDKGGHPAFARHYAREHLSGHYDAKPVDPVAPAVPDVAA